MAKTIFIPGRVESAEKGGIVTGASAIYDDTKGKKQSEVNAEVSEALAGLGEGKQDVLTFDNAPTENSANPVKSGGVYAADKVLSDAIEAILLLIPAAASALNKLADQNFVNSSVSTNTATFRGTSAAGLTEQQFLAWADSLTHDLNDYVFWQTVDADGNTLFKRYKWDGTQWMYEYTLNNSSFTAAEWAAIQSGITNVLVTKLSELPTAAALQIALDGKQDNLTFDNAPTAGSDNPVKSKGILSAINEEASARNTADETLQGNINTEKGRIDAINAKIPANASASNKLADQALVAGAILEAINALDASFNITSTDGHVTLKVTQADGVVTSVELTTTDIASAATLSTVATNLASEISRATQAEETLRALYNALQQSAPQVIEPTDTWPVANPSTTVIYRVIDRVNTPPEYYSDYMWNGTAFVLMATYNNAIDTTPKKDSANLITSGGVFANIGAFDISEYNKSGSTLATYADLTAALAALPSDFQKGGMSIKFVQSSDNKYVQYRLMPDTFSTTPSDWQGVDVNPTPGSKNFVESGGVVKAMVKNQNYYTYTGLIYRASTGVWAPLANARSTSFIPINTSRKIELYTYLGGNSYPNNGITFFDSDYNYISGYTGTTAGMQKVVLTENEIPPTAVYFTAMLNNGDNLDKAYILNGFEDTETGVYQESKAKKDVAIAQQYVAGLSNVSLLYGEWGNTSLTYPGSRKAAYIVIKVNGGDKVDIGASVSGAKIAIVSDYKVPKTFPYDFVFATGETASRNIPSGYSATLPNNAKYILMRAASDTVSSYLPDSFKINGFEIATDIAVKFNSLKSELDGVSNELDKLDIETTTHESTSYYDNTCDNIVGAIKEGGGGINTGGSYNAYRSYYFYAPFDGTVSINTGSASWFRMNTGVGTPESLTVKHYGAYGDASNPLPAVGSEWNVAKGDVVVFSALASVGDFSLTYTAVYEKHTIKGATVDSEPSGLLKWNGTYFEYFSKRKSGQYISFIVKHYQNDVDTVYQDLWSFRESKLYNYANGDMIPVCDLMNSGGESEFTMHITDKSDYTGGYHGDERLDVDNKCYVKFFADGREITASDMQNEFTIECDDFSYVEYTTLHETSEVSGEYVAGHPVIAYHLKKNTFKYCSSNIENYIKFVSQQSLSQFYAGIACISKNAATQGVMDGSITEKNGSTVVAEYGTLTPALTGTGHYFNCENTIAKNIVLFNGTNNIKANVFAEMLQGIEDSEVSVSQIWDRGGGDNDSKWYRYVGGTHMVNQGVTVANKQIIEFL